MQGSTYWRHAAASSSDDGRHVAFVEIEAERHHADAAELDVDVGAFGQFDDVLAPAGEDLLPAAGVGADAEYAADVVRG